MQGRRESTSRVSSSPSPVGPGRTASAEFLVGSRADDNASESAAAEGANQAERAAADNATSAATSGARYASRARDNHDNHDNSEATVPMPHLRAAALSEDPAATLADVNRHAAARDHKSHLDRNEPDDAPEVIVQEHHDHDPHGSATVVQNPGWDSNEPSSLSDGAHEFAAMAMTSGPRISKAPPAPVTTSTQPPALSATQKLDLQAAPSPGPAPIARRVLTTANGSQVVNVWPVAPAPAGSKPAGLKPAGSFAVPAPVNQASAPAAAPTRNAAHHASPMRTVLGMSPQTPAADSEERKSTAAPAPVLPPQPTAAAPVLPPQPTAAAPAPLAMTMNPARRERPASAFAPTVPVMPINAAAAPARHPQAVAPQRANRAPREITPSSGYATSGFTGTGTGTGTGTSRGQSAATTSGTRPVQPFRNSTPPPPPPPGMRRTMPPAAPGTPGMFAAPNNMAAGLAGVATGNTGVTSPTGVGMPTRTGSHVAAQTAFSSPAGTAPFGVGQAAGPGTSPGNSGLHAGIAGVTGVSSPSHPIPSVADAGVHNQLQRQLILALERVRASEARSTESERRAQWAEQMACDAAGRLTMSTTPVQPATGLRSPIARALIAVALVCIVCFSVGGYLSVLMPVRQRVAQQETALKMLVEARHRLEEQNRELIKQLNLLSAEPIVILPANPEAQATVPPSSKR